MGERAESIKVEEVAKNKEPLFCRSGAPRASRQSLSSDLPTLLASALGSPLHRQCHPASTTGWFRAGGLRKAKCPHKRTRPSPKMTDIFGVRRSSRDRFISRRHLGRIQQRRGHCAAAIGNRACAGREDERIVIQQKWVVNSRRLHCKLGERAQL